MLINISDQYSIQEILNDQQKALEGSKILVLSVAKKPDIDDIRESPALDVVGLLKQNGAGVSYHDLFIPELDYENIRLTSEGNLKNAVKKVYWVVIITNHSQ